MNVQAQELNLSQLPKLPPVGPRKGSTFDNWLPVISVRLTLAAVSGMFYVIRKRKFAEELEDGSLPTGLTYSNTEIFTLIARKRFRELLGIGRFGRVYGLYGYLANSKD